MVKHTNIWTDLRSEQKKKFMRDHLEVMGTEMETSWEMGWELGTLVELGYEQ
jgi:hypothetical protein